MCAVGMNAVHQLKRRRVELKHRKIAKLVPVGIENLVVVDRAVLAEYPSAIRIQVRLRGPALDLIQEGILPLVGVRQIKLV